MERGDLEKGEYREICKALPGKEAKQRHRKREPYGRPGKNIL